MVRHFRQIVYNNQIEPNVRICVDCVVGWIGGNEIEIVRVDEVSHEVGIRGLYSYVCIEIA